MNAKFGWVVAFCALAVPAFAGDYTLIVDGVEYDLDLDTATTVELPGGKSVQVTLKKKAIATFKGDYFSFGHPSEYSPARTDLGDGVFQTIMTTPLGTMVLVQEYLNIDPSSLVDFMLNELTKEEEDYGYKITRSGAEKTLSNGTVLKGKKARSEFRGEASELHVLSYSKRDSGLLIVTLIDKAAPPEDAALIETFWKSLDLKVR